MISITKYEIRLVKETEKSYGIDLHVNSPDKACEAFQKIFEMSDRAEELFAMLAVDGKNKIIGAFEISKGGLNSSLVHPREVFKRAMLVNANSIIIAHNHPSGDPTPSAEDIRISARLKEAGKILGIELQDHIIIGEKPKTCGLRYKSLQEEGLI